MDIRNFAKNIIGITGNETSHNGRYINFDGTPYGSKGMARLFLSPGLSANIALCGMFATPALLTGQAQVACYGIAAVAPKLVALDLAVRGFANRYISGGTVIDRQGSSSPAKSRTVEIKYSGMGIGMLPIVAAFIATGSGMSAYVMSYYWLSKLAQGRLANGRWTIVEPPAPRKRKPKEVKIQQGKLRPAFG